MQIEDDEIPRMDIDDARNLLNTILTRFDGVLTTSDEEQLAGLEGHSNKNSGAFRAKLADLRKYGFIDGHGEKHVTPLGRNLIEDNQRAIRTIIGETAIFEQAKQRWGANPIGEQRWAELLENQGIDVDDESVSKDARRIYNSMVRQLPEEDNDPFSEEYFDKYYSDLGEKSKQSLCINSLKKLSRRPVPSIEYYDKIVDLFEDDEKDLDEKDLDEKDLLDIVKSMCHASTDTVANERQVKTVDLAMGFLDPTYGPKVRSNAISILEEMDPAEVNETEDEDRLTDLWEITQAFGKRGAEEDDQDLLRQARQLFGLLLNDWADEPLLETMFEDTYEDYDADTDYGRLVGYWHEDCQDELGVT